MIATIHKPYAFNSHLITPLHVNNNPHFPFSPFLSSHSPLKFPRLRRRFETQASALVLPLLPFPIDQVLVPSEAKTLHLYEARYIALLEEPLEGDINPFPKPNTWEKSLFEKNKLFVHFVLDPIGFSSTSSEASYAARYGCLVTIEKVERLEIGALVFIRGVGRVKILELILTKPYLTGEVKPLQDHVLLEMTEISSKVSELKEALHSLNSLEIKLKAPPEALLQTKITNSLIWAEKQLQLDSITDFFPPVAERISFAAFQPVSGATQSELLKLQREKLTAMDVKDTVERLEKSMELVKNNIAILAAKLAIQSLEVP